MNHVSCTGHRNILPVLLVVACGLRAGKETLLEDTGVTALIESDNSQLLVGIFLDDANGVLVGVEGSHENQWHINAVLRVQVLWKWLRWKTTLAMHYAPLFVEQ